MGRRGILTEHTPRAARFLTVEARERAAWQRQGPVGWRLVKLFRTVVMLAVAYTSVVAVATLSSFYQGSGSIGARGAEERSVQVTVKSCERVGPFSTMGLGYWWVCRITVPTTDHGAVEAVVDRSIVTKDDIGKTVELRQACDHPPDGCTYGKAAGAGWQIYAGSVRILGRVVVFVFLLTAFFYLLMAVLGAPRYLVFQGWMRRRVR